jgi:hypothetical protein
LTTPAGTPLSNGTTTVGDGDNPFTPDTPTGETPPGETPRREMPGPSVRLALIVVALAVVVIAGGLIAQIFTGSNPPSPAPAAVPTAKGSPIKAIPGRADLAPLISQDQPPDDIVNAVVLPLGSVPGAVIDDTASAEGYDEQRQFTITQSQQNVIKFFEVELAAQGWHVQSTGPARSQPGFEVLAQRGGLDGYYWQIGAVVTPTTFPKSGVGSKTGLTSFEVRLYQVSDSG